MHRITATVHGWLLLLPAMALLALFTHWPALATFIDSFFSTPRPRRPSRFIGLNNYATIAGDPVFWQSLWNNLLFALGTIPVSIALAILMALWVNDRIAGRTLVRMAYFTPTILPMIAVATNLSHDGICSPVSTLDNDNGRGSYGVPTPIALVIDLDVIR